MRRLSVVLLLTLIPAAAQRPKPAYDPETEDGLLIEHIQQETDEAQKLHFMEEFAAKYPKHAALPWVYDQLQPAYFRAKAWDQVIQVGAARMALEPENLDAGKLALEAAEAKHDVAQIVAWSDRVWPLANSAAQKGAANAADAKQTAAYAEYLMYSTAEAAKEPKKRLELLQHLEQHMPSSQYAKGLMAQYFEIYRELGDEPKSIATAEKGLETEAANIDMLLFLAEVHARRDTPHDRQQVIGFTAKMLESIDKAQKPAAMSAEDWRAKKIRMTTEANYLGGVSHSLNHNWSKADAMLRAAIASMKENDPEIAPALYHLGMANYRLAEAGRDRSRPVDALKYLRRCAAIKGPFQDQAQHYAEGIRSEYNLQ